MNSVEDYLDRPYHVILTRDETHEGQTGFFAEVEELPGVWSQGQTAQEAFANLQDAMKGWLSVALEDGLEIPEPLSSSDFSGRFNVRLPQSLHAELSRQASREGVSLNQFVTGVLAGSVEWRQRSRV
jgi:antitoxin HicB